MSTAIQTTLNQAKTTVISSRLYDKHIQPIADTYAWVLMKNHFHLMVKIKDSPDRVWNPVRAEDPSKYFSNLFNSYAQAFNKRFGRHGNLFERPFKRKILSDFEWIIPGPRTRRVFQ